MEWRVKRLTQELRKHDKCLFAKRVNGVIQVWRHADKWSAADFTEDGSHSPTQFIFALTEDWSVGGNAVEWGIEPVMNRVLEMDLWNKVSFLEDIRKDRERVQSARKQSERNDIRARAADMRKEFAQATNEINTSNLEKVDSRRTKWH